MGYLSCVDEIKKEKKISRWELMKAEETFPQKKLHQFKENTKIESISNIRRQRE